MITSQQMRELEHYAFSKNIPAIELMENAGKQVYSIVVNKYIIEDKRVIIFCGTGNNGGDGLVAARHFADNNIPALVLLLGHKDNLSEEALTNYDRIKNKVNIISITKTEDLCKFKIQKHLQFLLIDAMLGMGTKGEVHEPISSAIDLYNSIPGTKISVDVPSGVHADTGEVLGKSCAADLIVTFHDLKPGLEKLQEKTVIADIGLPK